LDQRRLMSVRSEVVRDTIVKTICERARGRVDDPLPPLVMAALDAADHADLARAGYHARVVETELFEPARRPLPGLAEKFFGVAEDAWPDTVADVAGGLADREPSARPEPDDPDAISWLVPGPGGHVRHYVAVELSGSAGSEGKRDVIYGLLVRCCAEILPP